MASNEKEQGVVIKFDSLKVALSKQQKKIADMSLKIEQADARRIDLLQRLRAAELRRDKVLRGSKQVDMLLHREANFLCENISSVRTMLSGVQSEQLAVASQKSPQMIDILDMCLQHLHVLLHCSVLEPGKLEKDLASCGRLDLALDRRIEAIGSIPTLSPGSSVMSLNSITPRTHGTVITPRTEMMIDMATIEDVPDVEFYFGGSELEAESQGKVSAIPWEGPGKGLDPITDEGLDRHSESSHEDTSKQMSVPEENEIMGFTVTAGLEFARGEGPVGSEIASRRCLMPDTLSNVQDSLIDQHRKTDWPSHHKSGESAPSLGDAHRATTLAWSSKGVKKLEELPDSGEREKDSRRGVEAIPSNALAEFMSPRGQSASARDSQAGDASLDSAPALPATSAPAPAAGKLYGRARKLRAAPIIPPSVDSSDRDWDKVAALSTSPSPRSSLPAASPPMTKSELSKAPLAGQASSHGLDVDARVEEALPEPAWARSPSASPVQREADDDKLTWC